MELLKFLTSKLFLKHVGYILIGFFVLIIIIIIWLRIYTLHGQAYPVPSFKGMTIEDAAKLAAHHRLRVVVTDSIFQNDAPRGSVVDQNPDPGFKVKQNRTVFLIINAFSVPKVRMVRIVGVSLRQGQAILESNGLRIGKLIYVPDFAQNNILEQRYQGRTIEEGQLVDKGSAIDVVVGRGYSDQLTKVPPLIGRSFIQASDKIFELYLNVGAAIYDNSVKNSSDSLNALIWKQLPEPGSKLNLGSFVDLWLTIDSVKLAQADSLLYNIRAHE